MGSFTANITFIIIYINMIFISIIQSVAVVINIDLFAYIIISIIIVVILVILVIIVIIVIVVVVIIIIIIIVFIIVIIIVIINPLNITTIIFAPSTKSSVGRCKPM